MKKYKSTSIEYSYFIYAPDGKTIIGDVFIGIYKRHKQKKTIMNQEIKKKSRIVIHL